MKNKIIIIAILILAAFLRTYKISEFPAGFNADEAALGYNAYSLMLTGKDEHGHAWPVNLESFGDFKPAGYAYLLIPFIKVFGLTEFAVRFPSAIFGILGVFGIYLLTKELFTIHYSLFTALILAINPWAIHFSRGAWEVNVATTLMVFGSWLIVKWLKNPKLYYLLLSTFCYLASMYFYQSTRVIVPIFGLGILILYWRTFWQNIKQSIFAGILVGLLLLPLGISIFRSDAASRLAGVGLLADSGPEERVKELRGQHGEWNSAIAKVLHNKPLVYALKFVANYFAHWSGSFLFVNGDEIQRSKVPEMGLFYLTDFVFLAIGVVFLLRTMNSQPLTKIIWLWLFVAPLAAAVTFQTPHALRAHNMVIPMTILISGGIYQVFSVRPARNASQSDAGGYSVFSRTIKILVCVLVAAVYLWQIGDYWNKYYVRYPKEYPAAWEYGFKELVSYVSSVQNRYDKIWVTDKYDQPYILFLFYSQYLPEKFQGKHKLTFRDRFNFSTVRDYDKYHFESAPWDKVRDIHSTLIVAAPEDIPEVGVNIVKTIDFLNGKPAFKIVSN